MHRASRDLLTRLSSRPDVFPQAKSIRVTASLLSSLLSSLFLSSLFSSLDLLFSSLVLSLLFHPHMSFLFSPLSSSRFFSFLVLSSLFLSRLLFSYLVFSFLVLSSLSLSLFLCLSLSLSPCGVVFCGVVWCVWCVCVWLCVCVCVCCHTLKKCGKKPCVYVQNALLVCIQNVPVYAGTHAHMCFNMCAWCRYTRGSRGSSLVLLTKICPTYGYHVIQRFHKENQWIFTIFSLRISREQHVADSSNHSLSLLKLFSFSCPEEKSC